MSLVERMLYLLVSGPVRIRWTTMSLEEICNDKSKSEFTALTCILFSLWHGTSLAVLGNTCRKCKHLQMGASFHYSSQSIYQLREIVLECGLKMREDISLKKTHHAILTLFH